MDSRSLILAERWRKVNLIESVLKRGCSTSAIKSFLFFLRVNKIIIQNRSEITGTIFCLDILYIGNFGWVNQISRNH